MRFLTIVVALLLALTTVSGCSVSVSGRTAAVTGNALLAGAGVAMMAAGTSIGNDSEVVFAPDPSVLIVPVVGIALLASGVVGALVAAGDDGDATKVQVEKAAAAGIRTPRTAPAASR